MKLVTKITLSLLVFIIIGILLIWVFAFIPMKDRAKRSSAMKAAATMIVIYEAENLFYPVEPGELVDLFSGIIPEESRDFNGFYFLGANESSDGNLPVTILERAEPHWFYQRVFRFRQFRNIGFDDGFFGTLELAPDAEGLMPVLEAAMETFPERFQDQKTVDILRERVSDSVKAR